MRISARPGSLNAQQYTFLTSLVAARDLRPVEYLKNYVQFVTTVVGGCIWLKFQIPCDENALTKYFWLSNFIILLGSFVTFLLVWDNFRTWRAYRLAQVAFARETAELIIPEPKVSAGRYMELSIITCSLLTTVAFYNFNPFAGSGECHKQPVMEASK